MAEAQVEDNENIEREVGLQRGGQNLRNAIQEAQIRNNELIRQQRLKVENTGFEPVTSCLPGKRSSQMS